MSLCGLIVTVLHVDSLLQLGRTIKIKKYIPISMNGFNSATPYHRRNADF